MPSGQILKGASSWEFDDISRAERAFEREERARCEQIRRNERAERFRIDGRQAVQVGHVRQGGNGGRECYRTSWDANRAMRCAGDNFQGTTQVVGHIWGEAATLNHVVVQVTIMNIAVKNAMAIVVQDALVFSEPTTCWRASRVCRGVFRARCSGADFTGRVDWK